jgi:hypothetical protein
MAHPGNRENTIGYKNKKKNTIDKYITHFKNLSYTKLGKEVYLL